MNAKDSNDIDYAYVHVRHGVDLESKQHPIGTVAVRLVPTVTYGDDEKAVYSVGLAVSHPKKERWDAKRGREVARGRAAAGRCSSFELVAAPDIGRRRLVTLAVESIAKAVSEGSFTPNGSEQPLSDRRREDISKALRDTASRLRGCCDRLVAIAEPKTEPKLSEILDSQSF